MKVKDTWISNVQQGDLLFYRYRGLIPEGDFLGALIAGMEGNTGTDRDDKAKGFSKGDYTHVSRIRRTPDPEADVIEVSEDIYKVENSQTTTIDGVRPTIWEDTDQIVTRKFSKSGVKFEATWPKCQEWVIDWENPWMTVWRIRTVTPDDIKVIMALDDAAIGKQYDLAQFVTFGNLRLPSANICSEVAALHPYLASIAVNALYNKERAPIILTPDVKGMLDPLITPNDNINSGMLYKIRHNGKL